MVSKVSGQKDITASSSIPTKSVQKVSILHLDLFRAEGAFMSSCCYKLDDRPTLMYRQLPILVEPSLT